LLLPVRVRKCLAALSWENRSRSPIFTRNYVPSKSETGTAPVRRDSPYPHQNRAKQKFAQQKNRKMSSLIIPVFSLSGTISISEARRAGKVSYPHETLVRHVRSRNRFCFDRFSFCFGNHPASLNSYAGKVSYSHENFVDHFRLRNRCCFALT